MSKVRTAIARLVDGEDLSRDETHAVMLEIMDGNATDILVAGFLVALRMKGETAEEIAGAALAMRERAVKITAPPGEIVDTCGTGGDRLGTINVSTGAAIVAAAAGCTVAKHGNRAVSSSAGSADVLDAMGVNVDASPPVVERCLREVGVGFLFAPRLHGAMKHAMPARRELGVRTVFNLLGPLTNPAGATRQLVGVFDRRWVRAVAQVLGALGAAHALVVHGSDGMDEITISGPTDVAEWRSGSIREWRFDPADAGLARAGIEDVRGGDPQENAARLAAILRGSDRSPASDLVALNAAGVLYVSGRVPSIADGLPVTREALRSGAAWATFERLRETSRGAG